MALKEQGLAMKMMLSDPIYNPDSRGPLAYSWYQKTIDTIARPGTTVDFTSLQEGYFTRVGTPYYDAVNTIGIMERAYEAEKKGYDAFIIGCVRDSGLREARSLVEIPVVAPTESSALLSVTLGRKFSIIAGSQSKTIKYSDLIQSYGLGDKLASVRCPPEFATGTDYFELMFGGESGQKEFIQIVTAEMRSAVKEDSAEVVWFACTIGATILSMHRVYQVDGAVIMDPVIAALKVAEVMVDMRRAYGTGVCRASIYQPPMPGWEKERPIALD